MTRAVLISLLIQLAFVPSSGLADDDNVATLATPPVAAPGMDGSPDTSVFEVPAPPVVIEGELPHLELTPEELIQRFREALSAPPSFLSSERRLADGTIEATTRFGRVCAPSLPQQLTAGVGGDVRLVARCASF